MTLYRAPGSGLAVWPSEEIDRAVELMLASGNAPRVEAAVDLVGLRRMDNLHSTIALAQENDAKLRVAGSDRWAGASGLPNFRSCFRKRLNPTICLNGSRPARPFSRVDKASAIRLALAIDEVIGKASGEGRVYLMEQLASVGGPVALEKMASAAKSSDVQLQDNATRLLGEWLSPDVAPVLLELSKSLSADRFTTRATRGYIRVATELICRWMSGFVYVAKL